MANPYKKGTDAYLDYATEQHTKATAPKKAPVKKKVVAKKRDILKDAWAEAKARQKRWGNS